MDTSTKIMMKILDDIYMTESARLDDCPYSKYYDSLDPEQQKIAVKDALDKIKKDNPGAKYELGESEFSLSIQL